MNEKIIKKPISSQASPENIFKPKSFKKFAGNSSQQINKFARTA